MDITDIVSNFEFIGSCIKKVEMQNRIVYFSDEDINKYIDVSYSNVVINDLKSQEIKTGTVDLYINIILRSSDEKQEAKTTISMVINGCFSAPINIGEDEFKKLLTENGCATLYSIARATIMSLTAQAFTDGKVTLPMLNIFRLREETEKEQQEKQ